MTKRPLPCAYPFTHFEVNDPNGDVTFCCNHSRVLGNVNRQSIAEIWNGPEYQAVRRQFLAGRMHEICPRSCPVLAGWKDYEKLDWYRDLPPGDPVRENAERNEREIAAGQAELQSQPRWLRFATSYRCNLKCYHCYQETARRDVRRLPDRFLDEVRTLLPQAQILFLYGGEPLLEEANLALLETLASAPGATRLFLGTNGTVMNERIRAILEQVNLGLLGVSVDSIVPELYEELRAPAKWEYLRSNLDYFARLLRRQRGAYHLGMTINKCNYRELADYIVFADALGALPLFQFAKNASGTQVFRERYEIWTPAEWRACAAALTAARPAAAALPLTDRNLAALAATARANASPGHRLRQRARNLYRRVKSRLDRGRRA